MNAYRLPTPPDDSDEKREIADFKYAMGDTPLKHPYCAVAGYIVVLSLRAFIFLAPVLDARVMISRIYILFMSLAFEYERCQRRVIYDKPALDARAVVAIAWAVVNLPALLVVHEPAWLYGSRVASFGTYYLAIATYLFVRWRTKGSLDAAFSTRP